MTEIDTGRSSAPLPGIARIRTPRFMAALQALFVTFLWSTSWVLIKIGLEDIPALTFAGLRYSLAFLCLLPIVLQGGRSAALRGLAKRDWALLAVLGLLVYTVTQGAQFLSLAYLPAITVSLALNFTTVVVALMGLAFLAERLAALQWIAIALSIAGTVVFFSPSAIPAADLPGLAIAAVCVLANAGSSVLGRRINGANMAPPLVVTLVSMGIGGGLLLIAGVIVQGLPALSLTSWALIIWLAVVNTAFAFTLWNHTLRLLSAIESSMINSTMLVQITLLAWIFLDEWITWQKGLGMLLAGTGALVMQLRRRT